MIVCGRGRNWLSKKTEEIGVYQESCPTVALQSSLHQDVRYKLMVYLCNCKPTGRSIILKMRHNWTLRLSLNIIYMLPLCCAQKGRS